MSPLILESVVYRRENGGITPWGYPMANPSPRLPFAKKNREAGAYRSQKNASGAHCPFAKSSVSVRNLSDARFCWALSTVPAVAMRSIDDRTSSSTRNCFHASYRVKRRRPIGHVAKTISKSTSRFVPRVRASRNATSGTSKGSDRWLMNSQVSPTVARPLGEWARLLGRSYE